MDSSVRIKLPTFHEGQIAAYKIKGTGQHTALVCGRRWGKTDFLKTIAADATAKGQNVGIFTPDYKIQTEMFHEIAETLEPIKKASSRIDGVFRSTTGGRIDFWTLENERAGRSRKYHKILIDEAAFTKANMMRIWETAIEPSRLDYNGTVYAASTPNGISPDNFFYVICNDPKYGFNVYHAPTFQNPHIPMRMPDETEEQHARRRLEEFEKRRAENHPLVFRQEILAEFVDWSGDAFFSQTNLLVNEKPVQYPNGCDYVLAVIDTASKTGKGHDGTAVTFAAVNKIAAPYPVTILDWDIIQIEGQVLEVWLPSVFQQLEQFAKKCGARRGSLGAFIEDKDAGMVLLQKCKTRRWPAHPIDSKLTSMGKDERALAASGHIYTGKVKISEHAFHKTKNYQGQTRNHFLTHVCGFHYGIDNKIDDLLDTFTYMTVITLGNSEGFG